jgi:hypothetical protein
VSLLIVTDTSAIRTFTGVTPELEVLLSFRRHISVNWAFAPLAGQTDSRFGGLKGSESVSTRHLPLKPLPDPIPLKIRLPSTNALQDACC